MSALKSDIGKAKGRMAFLQTGDWGNVGAGYTDLVPKRFGAAPTEHLVDLFKHSNAEVYAALYQTSKPTLLDRFRQRVGQAIDRVDRWIHWPRR